MSESIALPVESDYVIVIDECEAVLVQATIYDNLSVSDYILEGQVQSESSP